MADWTTLSNSAAGVGGLPSGTTVTALRDNPVAIAEGAAGAPRVQGVALGGIFAGTASATRASSGSTTVLTITDLGVATEILLLGRCFRIAESTFTLPNEGLFYSTSTDGGSTWSAETQFLYPTVVSVVDGWTSDASERVDVSGSVNALRVRVAQSSATGSIEARATALIISGDA